MKLKQAISVFASALLLACASDNYEYEHEYEFKLHNATGMPLNIKWTVDGTTYQTTVMNGPASEMFASHFFLSHSHLTLDQLNALYSCVAYSSDSQYVSDLHASDLRYYSFHTDRDASRPRFSKHFSRYYYALTN
jgi:hypothetical protein